MRRTVFFERLENRQFLSGSASISGFVFNDLNADTHRASNEPGIANVRVYLDSNNNRKLDTGEKNTLTDSTGKFVFTKLNAGSYIVRQIVPVGMSQTVPSNGFGIHLTLSAGQSASNRLFGNVAEAPMAQPFWSGFSRDGQHTAISSVAAQNLAKLKWH